MSLSRLFPLSTLKSLYTRSPLWVKRSFAAIPFEWRAGSAYRQWRNRIREIEFQDAATQRIAQSQALHSILSHALQTVPYYSRNEAPPEPDEDPWTWLKRWPLIAKADLQQQGEQFHSSQPGEPVYEDNTGGSSGTPFSFLKNNGMYAMELAHMQSLWTRVGYTPRECKLTFRGRTFQGHATDQRWTYNPIYNEVVASSYHLDAATIRATLRAAETFRPRFMHGYPSAVCQFLQVAVENNLPLPQGIQAVLCGSEPLYEHQRAMIRDLLGCRAFSWYGQSECVLLSGECEHSSDYHVEPLYGVLELMDEQGQEIKTPGVEGEIVATCLNNTAMPFIRYRTGDRGIMASGPCRCGRAHPRLSRVTGRLQHYVVTSQGVKVPVTAFVFGQHFHAFQSIASLQLEQDTPGAVRVRIVRRPTYTQADESELLNKMISSVDGHLRVTFEYPATLPVNAAGKTDFVIQRIPINGSAPSP